MLNITLVEIMMLETVMLESVEQILVKAGHSKRRMEGQVIGPTPPALQALKPLRFPPALLCAMLLV